MMLLKRKKNTAIFTFRGIWMILPQKVIVILPSPILLHHNSLGTLARGEKHLTGSLKVCYWITLNFC